MINNEKVCLVFVYGNMDNDKSMRETIVLSELIYKPDIGVLHDCLCELAKIIAKIRGFDFGAYVRGYDCAADKCRPLIETEFEGIDAQFMREYITSERDFYISLKT